MEEEAREKARICIGGLGERVVADDLRKIFSAAGDVGAVDIIRTKGRSFGYVDLLPSSLNSIAKLFSTYNGCVWKGGRLRLEKAKEHYLARLEREREEAADPSAHGAVLAFFENPDEAQLSEKKHLRIFFPRLRKVKSLPFSGTGKHRYSFQRVEPPALPRHFCDCQEHSDPSDATIGEGIDHQEVTDGVINDGEINVMNKVMNMLLEREKIVCDTGVVVVGEHNSINSIGSLVPEDKADGDNIITNMVSTADNRCFFSGSTKKKRLHGTQNYNEGRIQHAYETSKNDVLTPSKKKKLCGGEESNRKEVESIIPNGKKVSHHDGERKADFEESETDGYGLVLNVLSGENNRVGFSRSNEKDLASLNLGLSQNVHKEQKENVLPPKKKRKSLFNPGREGTEFGPVPSGGKGDAENHSDGPECYLKESDISRSWSQKSSWRALVGDEGNNGFSLSSILPSFDADKGGQYFSIDPNTDIYIDKKRGILSVWKDMEPSTEEVLKKDVSYNKKRKSPNGRSDGNESVSPRKKGNSQDHSNGFDTSFVAQHTGSECDPQGANSKNLCSQKSWIGDKDNNVLDQSSSSPLPDPTREGETLCSGPKPENSVNNELIEAKSTKPTLLRGKSGRGSSWLHKSSWVQLVSQNTTFGISEIIPGSSAIQELSKPNCEDVSKSTGGSNRAAKNLGGSNNNRDASTAFGVVQYENSVQAIQEMNEGTVVGNHDFTAPVLENKIDSKTKKASVQGHSFAETCLFMRSAASVQEWAKVKAALSGSRKKSRREMQAS